MIWINEQCALRGILQANSVYQEVSDMDFRDYYKTLGVSKTANKDEIRKAFRKLARKYHPDVNTDADAEAKFKDLNEAYEVLKDPERRAAYDQMGQEPPRGQRRPPPDWDGGFSFSSSGPDGDEAFSDFFEQMFRGQRGPMPGGGRGSDSHARIEIDIEDAFRGATRVLNMRSPVVGPTGEISLQDRNISVHIPKGIRAGQHIRLAGQGTPSLDGGKAGDLFLEVSFAAHPIYRAEGKDLYLDLPLAPWEAALGGKIMMPTPGGKVDLSIPKNARSGQKLRLKGKGLPGKPPGDVYATLKIVNPKVSSDEARALFEQMAQAMPFDPRAHLGG
jgi:curved DNA-binding protein